MQKVYLVPHTHYDVAWAFTKEDYVDLNESFLKKAIDLMRRQEDYRFIWEQTYLLEIIEKRKPKLWADIKEMVGKGKLEIADGQYLMPDTMLPTGEVLVREILWGKRYCKQRLGIDVPVAWCADSFGMNAQMPQIYKKAGYKWVAFRRGTRRAYSELCWKGLDGSTIMSHWMPMGYRAGLDLSPEKLEQSYIELNRYAATDHILMPSGSGVTMPQTETVSAVKKWNKSHKDEVEMQVAVPSQFFQALEKEGKELSTLHGELYDTKLSQVFPQVCSSRMWVVIGTRKAERLIAQAECFATLAYINGREYPTSIMTECWRKVLFLAFHDIITGCGVDAIYEDVRDIFDSLETTLGNIITDSLTFLASRIATRGEAVVVFNPLPRRMQNWCQVDLKAGRGWTKAPGLKTEDGEIETQVLATEKDDTGHTVSTNLGFTADLPPLGYQVYRIVERHRKPQDGIKVGGQDVETPSFTLTTDTDTGIITLKDKDGRTLIKGNELHIDNETGDLYYHRYMFKELIKNESGRGLRYGGFKAKDFVVEAGPLMTKITYRSEYYCLRWPYRMANKHKQRVHRYKTMDVTKEVTVYRDLPRVEFTTKVDNRYPQIRLRVKFDTGRERMTYLRETQFGVVSEPTTRMAAAGPGSPIGIPHFLTWFCYGGRGSATTFMNKGIPASEISGGAVYLTLLRSVSVLSADGEAGPLVPTPDALELRDYTFDYAIEPHQGDWKQAKSYKKGQEYSYPPTPITSSGGGSLPQEASFLRITPDNIILSALKKAEDSDDIILRFFETEGQQTTTIIELCQKITRVTAVNLLEEEEKEMKVDDNKIILKVNAFEIVSLKLTL